MKLKRLIASFTALSMLVCGAFSVSASADDEKLEYKLSYTSKYTYLELTPSDDDYVIRYTTDGSVPTEKSKKFVGRLRAQSEVTVCAAQFSEDGERLDGLKIKMKRKCMGVAVSLLDTEDGLFAKLTAKTDGADIYYTTDGSKPTEKSDLYEGAFPVEDGTVIRAYAVKDGWKDGSRTKVTADADDAVKSVPVETAVIDEPEYNAASVRILELINEQREKKGLEPLEMDPVLYEAARLRCKEIYKDYGHQRPDGRVWYTILDEVSFDYAYAAENIAYSDGSLSTCVNIMDEWMDSPSHRKNILNEKGRYVGIAALKAGNRTYWVQIFGEPKD